MPGLPQYWLDIREAPNPEVEPEDLKLWLPSSLPQNLRIAICHEGLPEMELKLREAQLADHLNTVRHTLRLKTRMVQFKNKNVRGQRSSIRSRAIIDSIHERAKSAAVRYRTAREARLALEGSGEWCNVYRELKNEDVRSYQDPARAKPWGGRRGTEEDGVEVSNIHKDDDDINLFPGQRDARDGTGETRKELSWIWITSPLSLDDNADPGDDILRSEWCRSRARANRAVEEVRKLHEEMRRTLAFLEYQERSWTQRETARSVESDTLREGLVAYASKQAKLQRMLSDEFMRCWKEPLGSYNTSQMDLRTDDAASNSTSAPAPNFNATTSDNLDDFNGNDDSSDTDSNDSDNDDDDDDDDDDEEADDDTILT